MLSSFSYTDEFQLITPRINLLDELASCTSLYEELHEVKSRTKLYLVSSEGQERLVRSSQDPSPLSSHANIIKDRKRVFAHIKQTNIRLNNVIGKLLAKLSDQNNIVRPGEKFIVGTEEKKKIRQQLDQTKSILQQAQAGLKSLKPHNRHSTKLPLIIQCEKDITTTIRKIDKQAPFIPEKGKFIQSVLPCRLEDIQFDQESVVTPSQLSCVFNSCKERVKGYWGSTLFTEDQLIPEIKLTAEVLSEQGKQLNLTTSRTCLEIYKWILGENLHYSTTLLSETLTLKNLEYKDFKKTITEEFRGFKDEIPFVIQIGTGVESVLERDHTVVVLIKNRQIEYYDPKGLSSSVRTLQDGKTTLKMCLERMNNTYFNNAYEIYESDTPHQEDCHSCGAFVLYYLFNRLILNNPKLSLKNKVIPINYLNLFRKNLAAYITAHHEILTPRILGYDPKAIEKEKDSDTSLSDDEDFNMDDPVKEKEEVEDDFSMDDSIKEKEKVEDDFLMVSTLSDNKTSDSEEEFICINI